jgi:isoquinoline 1-oxidoreductase alpha subunit
VAEQCGPDLESASEVAIFLGIKVNGNTHSLDIDGDRPLLWALCDVLGVTSTKFGCGAALCRACTMRVDGMATRPCVTPIDSVGGSAIAKGIPARRSGARTPGTSAPGSRMAR